jgi:protein O-mannosyl-transferase
MTLVISPGGDFGINISCENKMSLKKMPSAGTQTAAPGTLLRSGGMFSSPGKRTLVLSLAIVLLTVIAYLPVRDNGFINFDDNHYITQNAQVRSGLSWDTVKWAFTTYDAANWHPLTWLSHALDCQLFGLNPAGPHFISVLLHALSAVLLFLLLQSLTGFTGRSLVVAALFAVHPLNVESVAWAAERKNVLSMLFFLLAIWAYSRYVRQPTIARSLGVAGLFALALMSKPQVIIFPFALLLLDYWPLGRTKFAAASTTANSSAEIRQRSFTSLLIEKIPLFGLSSISAIITLQAQHAGHAVRTVTEYSLRSRVETAIISYVSYLRDAVVPWHLAPIYPHADGLLATWKVLMAATVLIAISTVTVLGRTRAAYLLFGWLWFVGTLIPMIGLIQVGEQARADRYMYVSLIGILVAVIWGWADLLARHKFSPVVGAAACVAVLVAFSVATFRQIGHWRDSETLWNYTLTVTDRNFMAEDNLAQELATQGRTKEALVHFHNILNLHDWQPTELIAFGMYEQRQGYAADAIKQYQRALRGTTDAKTRAIELSNMGSAYMDLKDVQQAWENFDKALQSDPNNVPALIGTGLISQKNGNLELAIRQYTKAVAITPSDLGYALLGRAFEQSGRPSDANTAYQQAQRLSPNMAGTRSAVAHLLAD